MGKRIDFKKIKNLLLDLVYPNDVTCYVCGEEIHKSAGNGLCSECFNNLFFLKKQSILYKKINVYSCCNYDGTARNVILGAKINSKTYLTKIIAQYIAKVYKDNDFFCDVIAYVPSSKKNKSIRGYDHMLQTAKFLSDMINKPICKGLKRVGKGKDQTEVAHSDRYENVKNTYIYKGEDLSEKSVLLIDDVVTSGATITECATALSSAKPSKTVCITFARAESAYSGKKKSPNQI